MHAGSLGAGGAVGQWHGSHEECYDAIVSHLAVGRTERRFSE